MSPPQLQPLGMLLLFAFTWGLGGGLPADKRLVLMAAMRDRFAANPDFELPVSCLVSHMLCSQQPAM